MKRKTTAENQHFFSFFFFFNFDCTRCKEFSSLCVVANGGACCETHSAALPCYVSNTVYFIIFKFRLSHH